jgi:hypothetical protein
MRIREEATKTADFLIGILDDNTADPDLEPDDDNEDGGDNEPSLGWADSRFQQRPRRRHQRDGRLQAASTKCNRLTVVSKQSLSVLRLAQGCLGLFSPPITITASIFQLLLQRLDHKPCARQFRLCNGRKPRVMPVSLGVSRATH